MSASSTGHGSRKGFPFRSSGEADPGASRMPVHISHTLKPARRDARPHLAHTQAFWRVFHLPTRAIIGTHPLYGPTCAQIPCRALHPLSDLCPSADRTCLHPRQVPPLTSHPHLQSLPSSDSSRLCPCRNPRRGRPRPRTQNSRVCAKSSSTGSKRTNASSPCAHRGHHLGARWSAKS